MNIKELEKILVERKEPQFRREQVMQAIYKDGITSWPEITTLYKELRNFLAERIKILSFSVGNVLTVKNKLSAKALLIADDDCKFETVIMQMKPDNWTVCLSCQVGCPIGCNFCATGQSRFKRNLTSEEITDQVIFWQGYLKKKNKEARIDNVVFMGMGEPFLNWENVRQSIKDLTNPDLFGYGNRSISISTIGIIDGIKKLAKEFPQVNLAVSLHAANDKKRSELIPVGQQYNLIKLHNIINQYIAKTNRKVFLEYILLKDVNDSRDDARELANYIKSFDKPYLLHVNLISYNETNSKFKPVDRENMKRFASELANCKISVTIRRSIGQEIKGACGQLTGKD